MSTQGNATINGRNVEISADRYSANDVAVAIAEDYRALGYATHGQARNAVTAVIDDMAAGWTELVRVASAAASKAAGYGDDGSVWLTAYQVEQVRAAVAAI